MLSRHQNANQNQGIKKTNKLFENLSQFKYLEMMVTNQNFIQEEIERRLTLVMLATIQSRIFCCSSAVKKLKNSNMGDYNFACGSEWV
jgi:hypothetical protein